MSTTSSTLSEVHPSVAFISPSITKITGPLLLGNLFNWCLYGVLIMQVYVYNCHFPGDKRRNKFLVYFLFVMETIQTALTGVDAYNWLAVGFGNPEQLQNTYFAPIDMPILIATIAFVVRTSFCYRFWAIERTMLWWCGIIEAASFVQWVAAVGGGIVVIKEGNFSKEYRVIVFAWVALVTAVIVDLSIAATMSYLLTRALKCELKPPTKHVLRRLLYLIVECNIASAAVATVVLATFVAAPGRAYWYFPLAIAGKFHSNTLLASFNNRIPRHDCLPHTHVSSLSIDEPTLPISEARDARCTGTQNFGGHFTRRNPSSVTESSSSQTPSIHSGHGELHMLPALSPPPLE